MSPLVGVSALGSDGVSVSPLVPVSAFAWGQSLELTWAQVSASALRSAALLDSAKAWG